MPTNPNRNTERELPTLRHRHAVVAQLSHRALANLDLDQLLRDTVLTVTDILAVDGCLVLELLPDGITLQLRAGAGVADGMLRAITHDSAPDTQLGYTLLTKEAVRIDDLATTTRFRPLPPWFVFPPASSLSVLIDDGERPFGVLVVTTARPRRFRRPAMRFLQTIADVLAAALARYRVEAALRQLTSDLERRVHQQTASLRDANAQLERELAERQRVEAQLAHDAVHDALTGLPNRTLFRTRLVQALARVHRRGGPPIAVLFLDIDGFKTVNDSLGHAAGDELLRQVARRLETELRPGDTVARLGGDEFTLLLDNLEDASHASRVAERILRQLARPFTLDGHEIMIRSSIGITLSGMGYREPDEVLREADLAMYRAKGEGGARSAVFDPAMHARAVAEFQFEAELRQAVDRQELMLYYQPIVALASGRVLGVEALVRWQHPTRGLLGPAAFLPLAQDTGLIVPLGEWVVATACRQVQRWQAQDPRIPSLFVSVNLSAREFAHKDLGARLAGIVQAAELEPHHLALELTERSLGEDESLTTGVLADLRAMHVHSLALDDFGIGDASLNYLTRWPVTTVKIDRSWVAHVATNPRDAVMTRAMIGLARQLGLQVIAEGVETAAQLAFLRDAGCDAVQGYLVSSPLPVEAVSVWLGEVWPGRMGT